MPKADWDARYTDDTAKPFLSVVGLQWKIWLDDEKDQRSGGIYCFADRVSAEQFREHFNGESFDPADRGRGNRWFEWNRP